MDNELKNEAKATLQAGAVNVSTDDISIEPNANLNFYGSGQLGFPGKFIRGARKALNPVKLARQDAEVKQLESDAIAKAVAAYREAFPTFSDKQLFMLAHGYGMTPAQAENVLDVLDRAGKNCEGDKHAELPASCVDIDIQGAQGAYEEELREIWSKLIAQEATTGEARSKRTKAILESMDADDARRLRDLLGFCLWTKIGPHLVDTPIPVLLKTVQDDSWTYNGGLVHIDTISALDSLGVLTFGEWVTFTANPGQAVNLVASSRNAVLINRGEKEVSFELAKCKLLKPGMELAEILRVPTDERVFGLMETNLDVDVLREGKTVS